MRVLYLYILLVLAMAEANGSLLKIFAIDLSIIESDQLMQEDCQLFQVINAHFSCNHLQKKLESLKRYKKRRKTDPEKIKEKEEEIAELRGAFYQQVHYLETDYFLEPICLDCSLVEGAQMGQLDAIEELQKQLFCDHQNEWFCRPPSHPFHSDSFGDSLSSFDMTRLIPEVATLSHFFLQPIKFMIFLILYLSFVYKCSTKRLCI